MLRSVFVAQLLGGFLGTFTWAGPSSVPSSALNKPTATALLDDVDGGVDSPLLSRLVTPISGQISFKTKTRNGVRGLLPKPPGLNLWGKKPLDEGLDTAKRFLHVTSAALVLEVEGDDECLSISRGPESGGGAVVTVVNRKDAGIAPGSPGHVTTIPVDGLFGVYDLLSGPFVAVIRRSKLRYANRELGVEFRQVSKVRLIPVLAAPRALDEGEAREEARLLALLALAFRSHQFYFSHAHDVTHTLQRLRISAPATAGPSSSSSSSSGKTPSGHMENPPTAKKASSRRGKDEAGRAPEPAEEEDGNKARGRRGLLRKKLMGKGENAFLSAGKTKPSSPSPPSPVPSDKRFFWNFGVLGSLLELREELLEGSGDGGS
ncbi:unnamed protein product, partial [Laminaria digitata]